LSVKHPIIVITRSSGAGTSTVRTTFEEIFRREGVTPAIVEGDAFHRYDREKMQAKLIEKQRQGYANFSRHWTAGRTPDAFAGKGWSEWGDSNSRPPAPEAGALPGCATLRLNEADVYRQAPPDPQPSAG
jgi:Phosphoribulokinase / Uridine kinase family